MDWSVKPCSQPDASSLAEALELSETTARVLVRRGYSDPGEARAFLEGAQGNPSDAAFIELWQRSPRKRLGFRFGYVDKDAQAHLVITRPK